MVKITIIISDEKGQQMEPLKSREFEAGSYRLDQIERLVEELKKEMLPELTKSLLEKGQREFTEDKKKMVC
jgi:predicted translin family RNA/ssDNA-binding protein